MAEEGESGRPLDTSQFSVDLNPHAVDVNEDKEWEHGVEGSLDFGLLAEAHPALRPHLIPLAHRSDDPARFRLEWRDPAGVATLTEAILRAHYGLAVQVPTTQLIPAIPLRLNYILWIEQLVGLAPANAPVVGVDIGCGPLAVYALLGAARNPSWQFVCTDIDSNSIALAKANAARNPSVAGRLTFATQPDPAALLRNVIDPADARPITFCMFNPPFFAAASDKKDRSDTVCTATAAELVHQDGGEMALFHALVEESFAEEFRVRVQWFTFMFGIKAHLRQAAVVLRNRRVEFVLKKSFIQGKTHRWAVGWTHMPLSPKAPSVSRTFEDGPAPKRRKVDLQPTATASVPTKLVRFRDVDAPAAKPLLGVVSQLAALIQGLPGIALFSHSKATQEIEFVQVTTSVPVEVLLPCRVQFVAGHGGHSRSGDGRPAVTIKLNVVPHLCKKTDACRVLRQAPERTQLLRFAEFADSVQETISGNQF